MPQLTSFVECYWSFEQPPDRFTHRVLPDGCVDILFTRRFGEPMGLSLVGLMTVAKTFDIPPQQECFGVRFRPGMAGAFFPDAADLTDRVETLDIVSRADSKVLIEQLAECSSPREMVRLMNSLLRPAKALDGKARILQELSRPPASLDLVSKTSGMSARQLRRVCADQVGISPKYLLRILRFRRLTDLLSSIEADGKDIDFADLALACGYFDQAHLIHEFREFSGDSPGRFLQSSARLVP